MKKLLLAMLTVTAAFTLFYLKIGNKALAAQDGQVILNTEFAADIESKLALSGGPEHIRSKATVYVYKRNKGFQLYRQGSNGFTCLLNRDAFLYGRSAFKPTCWDKQGQDSYIPVMLAVGQWLAEGKGADNIKTLVEDGFQSGAFKSPETTGIAYMVAGDVALDLETGEVLKTLFPGHHMYYAPYVTTTQLGGEKTYRKNDPSLPRVFAGGAGGERLAYIITMIGHVNPE